MLRGNTHMAGASTVSPQPRGRLRRRVGAHFANALAPNRGLLETPQWWSGRQDSNLQPCAWKALAQPLSYYRIVSVFPERQINLSYGSITQATLRTGDTEGFINLATLKR